MNRTTQSLLAALLLSAAIGPTPGRAQGQEQRPAPPPRPRMPSEAAPLLDANVETWMAGVAALRSNPRARDIVLQALASRPASPRRWRLAHHLIEWGTPQDTGILSTLLGEAEGVEQRALLGALTALYPRPAVPLDLATAVAEFVFVPREPPQAFAPETTGKYVVTDLAIQTYHQENLPVRLIERIMGLKGRAYDSRSALADAMGKQLQGRQWADFGERLLAPVSPVPARVSLSGDLQVRLNNPAQRPLLLVLTFQCWYGRFDPQPASRYVLIPPGETALEEVPVRLIAPAEPGRARIFLHYHELNAAGQVEAQKLDASLRR